AVTDIELIVDGVDRQVGGAAEVLGIRAAGTLAPMTELRQELALRSELEDLVVLLTVSPQPDVVFRVDKDAVLDRRPLIALPGAAPGSQQRAVLIDLQHGRSRDAAFRPWWCHGCTGETFVLLQRAWSVQHPNVIVAVDRHPADRAYRPLFGERLRKRRI